MNISDIVSWAYTALTSLQQDQYAIFKGHRLTKEQRAKIAWVLDYKDLIIKLYRTMNVIDQIGATLKGQGLNQTTVEWSLTKLGRSARATGMNAGVRRKMIRYLNEQYQRSQNLEQEVVICTSDIIESFFGKYKEQSHNNPRAICDSLQMVGYRTKGPQIRQVKHAMERSRICDAQEWIANNLWQRR